MCYLTEMISDISCSSSYDLFFLFLFFCANEKKKIFFKEKKIKILFKLKTFIVKLYIYIFKKEDYLSTLQKQELYLF